MNMSEFYSEFLFRYQTDAASCGIFLSMRIVSLRVLNIVTSSNGIVRIRNVFVNQKWTRFV